MRKIDIGFDNLISALEFTDELKVNPGTYSLLGHNCVQAVRDAASAAGGSSSGHGGAPQYFGMFLGYWYPNAVTNSPLVLP